MDWLHPQCPSDAFRMNDNILIPAAREGAWRLRGWKNGEKVRIFTQLQPDEKRTGPLFITGRKCYRASTTGAMEEGAWPDQFCIEIVFRRWRTLGAVPRIVGGTDECAR